MRSDTTGAQAHALAELLHPERLSEVLDIGANPLDEQAPYAALLAEGLCHVTGFEPQPEALERLRREAGPHETYLPHAIGDGTEHVLHTCAMTGFSSLLEPDEQQLALLVDFPRMAEVVSSTPVQTTRLDDVEHLDRVDHLKIDVQGSELMVFRHGRRCLSQVTSIQTEVGFHRIYRDQPLFAEVDAELRQQGFVPQAFVNIKDWPLAPVQWADELSSTARQLVEADVLYVRDPARLDQLDEEQLRHLVLVCHVVHGRHGIALLGVRELVRRGVLACEAEQRYRELALAGRG
ncbi:FkbM family methyltransferase [Luteococcus peritonei]|uniref:FkbM family methyltransferase n=1 Tax=Luteococcus peritonei TaxID=88874 RepID=A0ABW4RYR1_9ACTN